MIVYDRCFLVFHGNKKNIGWNVTRSAQVIRPTTTPRPSAWLPSIRWSLSASQGVKPFFWTWREFVVLIFQVLDDFVGWLFGTETGLLFFWFWRELFLDEFSRCLPCGHFWKGSDRKSFPAVTPFQVPGTSSSWIRSGRTWKVVQF